jgi:hypothetical protein
MSDQSKLEGNNKTSIRDQRIIDATPKATNKDRISSHNDAHSLFTAADDGGGETDDEVALINDDAS